MDQHGVLDYLLRHVADTFGRQLDQVVQEQIGIGMSQYRILHLQKDQPRILQAQIASHLGQSEPSISRQIKLLLEKGLLVSVVNASDRREHHNHLTPKGLKVLENTDIAIKRFTSGMFGAVADKQQRQLIESLTVLHQKTCFEGRPYACDFELITQSI